MDSMSITLLSLKHPALVLEEPQVVSLAEDRTGLKEKEFLAKSHNCIKQRKVTLPVRSCLFHHILIWFGGMQIKFLHLTFVTEFEGTHLMCPRPIR